MPNNTRIPICPYYRYEKNKSISCEDAFRTFAKTEKKDTWMDMYCDSWDWMKCPYACDLTEAYERFERGDEKALENHEIEALRKELKSISTKLGRAEKRCERQQKKIDELRNVNQSLTQENIALDVQNKRWYRKWREATEHKEAFEQKVYDQVQKISRMYEQRISYLIENFAPGHRFYEADASAWAEDKAFALVYETTEDSEVPCWQVRYGEETEPDGHEDKDVQTDVQEGPEVRQQEV